jgi:regulator of replication initiation timing
VREGYDETMLERLARAVIVFAGSRITEPLLTWQGVNNALLNERIRVNIRERQAAEEARRKAEQEYRSLQDTLDEKQRAIRKQALEDARSEAEKILDGFDNDLHYYEKQIEDLTKANDALQIENQGLKSRLDSSGETPLIHSGREADLYPGEIRDLLLTQLSDTLSSVGDKTRRRDVIEDILSANEWDHRSEKNAEEIKKLLKTYAGMTSAIRQKLESLGFMITEDGKHYKLTYYGDDRYQIILSKTPSDIRTGKNSSQKLSKMVF